jgi:Flp pilus assembly protein TadG
MKWRGFRKSKDGVAAVEFALLLPVMITLFFGVVETSLALLCRADVSMASTAADLISQVNAASTADITNIYAAAGTILYPYPSSGSAKPTIRLTSVTYDPGTQSTTSGKMAWTCMQSGSGTLSLPAYAVGATVPLPKALMTNGGSVVIAEVAYKYSSPTTSVITGPINMANNFYTKPRRIAQITAPPSPC